jgi:hypothetical protein
MIQKNKPMKTHTCSYEIGIDREIEVEGKVYYCAIDFEVGFDEDADAIESTLEISQAIVCLGEGENMAVIDHTKCGDKVRVPNPVLEREIDQMIWDEINQYGSDNASDIAREVSTDYDEMKSLWNSDL